MNKILKQWRIAYSGLLIDMVSNMALCAPTKTYEGIFRRLNFDYVCVWRNTPIKKIGWETDYE